MRKPVKYLSIAAAIAGLAALNFYAERIKEADHRIEVSAELQEIGVALSHIQAGEDPGEIFNEREFEHINPQSLEFLPLPAQPKATDPALIYREPGKSFIFHLDGHVSVHTKKD